MSLLPCDASFHAQYVTSYHPSRRCKTQVISRRITAYAKETPFMDLLLSSHISYIYKWYRISVYLISMTDIISYHICWISIQMVFKHFPSSWSIGAMSSRGPFWHQLDWGHRWRPDDLASAKWIVFFILASKAHSRKVRTWQKYHKCASGTCLQPELHQKKMVVTLGMGGPEKINPLGGYESTNRHLWGSNHLASSPARLTSSWKEIGRLQQNPPLKIKNNARCRNLSNNSMLHYFI